MITFNTSITNIKTYSLNDIENIVKEVRFEIKAKNNGKELSSFFPVIFDNFNPDNYVSFDKLTEQQIIDWVTEQIGSETIEALKDGLDARLQAIEAESLEITPQETNLPWATQLKGDVI
jgi:hypothetical protein